MTCFIDLVTIIIVVKALQVSWVVELYHFWFNALGYKKRSKGKYRIIHFGHLQKLMPRKLADFYLRLAKINFALFPVFR